ncbi:hypothetical protein [Photobacterium sp. OFAV2-7]|uniref:hypothetical protein n=1 Tax=Photobacterium sp. OFAV2-7 TaxID=2917748 RepID=UPI001EF69124|nr:hypothetical protein [Photobacterium sp. OFAV2-7]MCG7586854.1 hypothetical protein [Photobacterium sp. OFAV2-7]
MKNQLVDLNNHLFAQMERLSDESLNADELQKEIERSKAVSSVSKQIIENASLVLDGMKFKAEYAGKYEVPMMVEDTRDA